jgi:hypothetical protein
MHLAGLVAVLLGFAVSALTSSWMNGTALHAISSGQLDLCRRTAPPLLVHMLDACPLTACTCE